MSDPLYIGIDVGTGSARAGIFDRSGHLRATAKRDIALFREQGDVVEQSSRDIWAAVTDSVREALSGGIDPEAIAGIGFDATCSLVVLGPGGKPLPVGPSGDADRNVIVWMDHRATAEAAQINAGGHRVLDYVGGTISPEMETPKLAWLAKHQSASFDAAWQFFDLADFLTWRASGSLARSTCTLTCKWTYLAHERRWDAEYFKAIGLGMLAEEGFRRIGTDIRAPGEAVGGLTPEVAEAWGLRAGIPVAAGLIDAHAGGVGTVGARGEEGTLGSRMAYVMGTSACTMVSTAEPVFVPGVWGPYFSAMVPGMWLGEGGQSTAGAGLDHLVTLHPAAHEARVKAGAAGASLTAWLGQEALAQEADPSQVARLAGGVHVVPEFLGNRAPFADPNARAIIAGLGMDTTQASLVGLYVAGVLGLGYGCRQLIETMAASGIAVDTIAISGGAGASPLVRQLLADATGLTVAASTSPEPVLLGSAILGAVAGGAYPTLVDAMSAMSSLGATYRPTGGALSQWHDQRYRAFTTLQQAAHAIRGDH
jgi:D-ribulokinase